MASETLTSAWIVGRLKALGYVIETQTFPIRTILEPGGTHYYNGSARTAGESGQVISAGYMRFAGMVGTFPTFHTSADRGEAIDYAQLEQIAAASAELIQRFAEMPD